MKNPLIQPTPTAAPVLAPIGRRAPREAWQKFGPPYWAWAAAAGSCGIAAGWYLPESDLSPIQLWAICAALLGFGIWFAVVNSFNRRGEGRIADILLGVFLSALLTKYGMLLGMALRSSE
jgi:hypothetical protein